MVYGTPPPPPPYPRTGLGEFLPPFLEPAALYETILEHTGPLGDEVNTKLDAAEKGAPSGVAPLDGSSKLLEANIPARLSDAALGTTIDAALDGAGIKGVDDGSNATGFYKNGADKVAYTIGNAPGSAGFAGTGSPPKALGALAIYQKFGDTTGGTNAPVTNTTQAAYLLANYYGPTTDDSAEAYSTFVGIKNTGTGFTQAKPVTAFEAIAQIEGSNTVTGAGSYALGVGSRINVINTAHVDDAYGFKASVNSSGGPVFGTITNYRAFYQPVASGATNPYGVYVIDPANSETQVSVGRSSGTAFKVKWGGDTDGSTSLAQLGQPTTSYGTLSGTYTLTTTPQTLTTNAGVTLPAGGGTFMLDSSSRTIVTYTAFAGTTISGAVVASGSVATTNGQLMLDPATPNTTTLRINAQRGQSKNINEWYDSGANLRLRVNAQGNLVTQGTSFFAANGSATTLAEMSGSAGYVRPGTTAGPGSRIFSGTGAPNVSTSVAGDTYIRTDTPTTANQRIYIATASNTWTGIV
jgi:hypothetical protein